MFFRDRTHAGQLLAAKLSRYADDPDLLICALPRGGVVVGFEVAEALNAPLDVLIVRKLGVPGQEELAMGAISSGGIRILRDDVLETCGVSPKLIEAVTAKEKRELERRERLYRGHAAPLQIQGRTVILVDDGIATGSTMLAAATAVRQKQPKRLVIAVPVAPPSACLELESQAEEFVCLAQPELFVALGYHYEDFRQVSDDEVRDLLQRAAKRVAGRAISMHA